MTEQQTPVLEQPETPARMTPPAGPPAAPSGKKKKKKGSTLKIVIAIVVAIVVIVAIALVLYQFVFKATDENGTAMTDFVRRDSIQSIVEGSGTTKAKDSANITPTAGGTILNLFVKEGDLVTEGQQLYRMDDSAAQDAVTSAQKTVTNCQKELQSIYDAAKDLTITAPHAGKLMDVADIKVGDDVASGTKIATIVNDTKLRLSLYFSYTYENQISVGQKVQISVPAIMGTLDGTVEKINYVRRVVPEGSVTFEVIFVMKNPGTLTSDMDASVSMQGGDGTPIYPYENGKLEYYETTTITAKTKGPVERVDLINYGDVKAGQLLVQLGAEDNDEEIAAKENALKTAQDKLDEALKELQNYNAVAPIAGTVLSCNLTEGGKVESGQGITIADTSQMIIEIQVDERNMQYVKAGMGVNIDQWGTPFFGIVESVSQTAKGENGVATFPAIVKVDNLDGTLMSGMYVNYNFVASQSDDCLVVPVQAVKYVSFSGINGAAGAEGEGGIDPEAPVVDGDVAVDGGAVAVPESYDDGGFAKPLMSFSVARPMPGGDSAMGGGSTGESTGTIVFIKADSAPEGAILEPDPSWECPKGFFAIPVTVGLADNTKVEILSGLNEGDEVFIGYETQNASSWG